MWRLRLTVGLRILLRAVVIILFELTCSQELEEMKEFYLAGTSWIEL